MAYERFAEVAGMGFEEESYLLELRIKGHEFVDWFVDREMRLLRGKITAPSDSVLEWLNTRYRITITVADDKDKDN